VPVKVAPKAPTAAVVSDVEVGDNEATATPAIATVKAAATNTTADAGDLVAPLPKGFFDDDKKDATVHGKKSEQELKTEEIEKEFAIFKEDIRPALEQEVVDDADAASIAAAASLAAADEQLLRLQALRDRVKRPKVTEAAVPTTKPVLAAADADDDDDGDAFDSDNLWRSKRL
jgi:hypothetical protein